MDQTGLMSQQQLHSHQSGKNLQLAFFLNLGFTIVEIFGGLYTNSIAILSDALHDLGDSLSLGLSWFLDKKSHKKADQKYTFGYRRFSLLGALINSVILMVGSVFVIREAVIRFMDPQVSDAGGMIIFAVIGIAVNGYSAWTVSKGKSLNEKVVSWHLLEDVLGWAAVLIAAVILYFYEILWLDPALSVGITLFVLYNVFKRLKETVFVFLQGNPAEIDLEEVRKKISAIEKVHSLHHTHLWSLDGEHHVFTTHIKLKHISRFQEIINLKERVKNILKDYGFSHYTIETELDDETCALKSN